MRELRIRERAALPSNPMENGATEGLTMGKARDYSGASRCCTRVSLRSISYCMRELGMDQQGVYIRRGSGMSVARGRGQRQSDHPLSLHPSS